MRQQVRLQCARNRFAAAARRACPPFIAAPDMAAGVLRPPCPAGGATFYFNQNVKAQRPPQCQGPANTVSGAVTLGGTRWALGARRRQYEARQSPSSKVWIDT